jgi:hypothetical protein
LAVFSVLAALATFAALGLLAGLFGSAFVPSVRAAGSATQTAAYPLIADGGTAYATARERLAGRDWVAYSTFSHSAEEERYHIVVRLPEPIAGEHWAESYDDLLAEIGGGDSLRAPCHAYFLPQHRPGADWFFEVSR